MTERDITVKDGRPIGYITTSEYAEQCGVQKITVRQWIRRGKLETVQIGRQHFIPSGTEKPGRKRRNSHD